MSIDEKLTFLDLEDIREDFLKKNNIKEFLNTYKYKVINPNVSKTWNDKFKKVEKLKDQDGMTKDKINYISSYIKPFNQPIELLDIGIGQGYLEQAMQKYNIKLNLSAVDISDISIKRAIKLYKANAYKTDAVAVSKVFEPKSFDVICAIELIEHIPSNQIFNFYKSVRSLLKKDGIFIISTPLNEGLRYKKENPSCHVREYTEKILRAEFKLANFKIIHIKTHVAFGKNYIVKKLLSKFIPNRWEANNIIIIAKKA